MQGSRKALLERPQCVSFVSTLRLLHANSIPLRVVHSRILDLRLLMWLTKYFNSLGRRALVTIESEIVFAPGCGPFGAELLIFERR